MDFLATLKALFSGTGKSKLPIINVEKRFDLLGRTGQGSMSKVWRARDRQLGRTICLKVLDKEKTVKFGARFPGLKKPTEGAICMCLRHKNIVQTFEHGMTTKGEQYLVMELIEGMGLNFLIETKSSQLDGNRLNFLLQITQGIEYLHRNLYLHRDLCPRNVMVTKEGLVKIIDFGLTVPYRPEFCRPGNRTGTTEYLAPEVIKRTSTDNRLDLFMLGVTAYEVFTGALPWERQADSMQTLLSHMNNAPTDPRQHQPNLDKRIAKVLLKSVEREPKDRYQSAADFAEALKALPQQ